MWVIPPAIIMIPAIVISSIVWILLIIIIIVGIIVTIPAITIVVIGAITIIVLCSWGLVAGDRAVVKAVFAVSFNDDLTLVVVPYVEMLEQGQEQELVQLVSSVEEQVVNERVGVYRVYPVGLFDLFVLFGLSKLAYRLVFSSAELVQWHDHRDQMEA